MALERFFGLWCQRRYQDAVELLRNEDFRPYQNADSLKNAWLQIKDGYNTSRLSSGGSSGERTMYHFGPMAGLIEIEHLIKDTRKPTLMLLGGEGNGMAPTKNTLLKGVYQLDYDQPDYDQLRSFFDREPGNLYCRPNILLYLSKEQGFLDFLAEGRVTSIISTEWEPFFDESVFMPHTLVNDNMASWKHGHMFTTCRYYNRHALPFSINDEDKSANLLNLADKTFYHNDDTMELSPQPCPCGLKWPLVKKFLNHTDNHFRPVMELRKKLTGQYLNCQFIRTMHGTIELHATTKDGRFPEQDMEAIHEACRPHSTKRNFRILAGIKHPNFWSFKAEYQKELVKRPRLKVL